MRGLGARDHVVDHEPAAFKALLGRAADLDELRTTEPPEHFLSAFRLVPAGGERLDHREASGVEIGGVGHRPSYHNDAGFGDDVEGLIAARDGYTAPPPFVVIESATRKAAMEPPKRTRKPKGP